MTTGTRIAMLSTALLAALTSTSAQSADLARVPYNNPTLVVDLGVGLWAWPLPMDYDGDGDHDLLVVCPDKPHNGVYFFENPGAKNGDKLPVFKPGVRLGPASHNFQVSYVDGKARILKPGYEFTDFRNRGFEKPRKIYPKTSVHPKRTRANQWRYVDYDGDDRLDLIVGVGDWTEYGWDNAYDAQGRWKNGPLRGYVYLLRNKGTTAAPQYAPPRRVQAGGRDVDVFGMPSPNFADFDGDGDLDLLCGEFLDGFTYFENVGSRTGPVYARGTTLNYAGRRLHMHLQMITPTALDWDRDGDVDLIVGDEDGRVALVEHTGRVIGGVPQFMPPRYFQQQAEHVKFGALATPFAYDWDNDGDEDVLCGNTSGEIGYFENLGGAPPRWARVRLLEADGRAIRILAGSNGSIQGPCEAKWGYTTLSVTDWNHDDLPDLIVNSIWGKVVWYRNVGSRARPKLAAAQPVEVQWKGTPPKPAWNWWDPSGNSLVTQWRTTPMAVDFTGDGLTDLVMLDHQGYLCLFERRRRDGRLQLLPPERIFVDEDNQPLRLNGRTAGGSGRRKIMVVDWDADGRLDVLANSGNGADWYRNCETRGGRVVLRHVGPLSRRQLAGHTSSPAVVDWNKDGKPDLLVGAEDGYLYHVDHNDAVRYAAEAIKARPPKKAKPTGLPAKPGVVRTEFIFE